MGGRSQPRREPLVGDGHAAAEDHRGCDVLVDRGGHHLLEPAAGLGPDPVELAVAEPALCQHVLVDDLVRGLAHDRDTGDRRRLAVGIEVSLAATLRELSDDGEGQVGLSGEQHVVCAPLQHVVDEEPGGHLVLADRVDDPFRDPGQVAAPPVLGLPGLVHPQQRAHRVVAGHGLAALDRGLDDRHQPLRLGAVRGEHGQSAQSVPTGRAAEQPDERLDPARVGDHHSPPRRARLPDPRGQRVRGEDRQRVALGVRGQRGQQRRRRGVEAEDDREPRRPADDDPVDLGAQQRRQRARGGDEQHDQLRQPRELQRQRHPVRVAVRAP